MKFRQLISLICLTLHRRLSMGILTEDICQMSQLELFHHIRVNNRATTPKLEQPRLQDYKLETLSRFIHETPKINFSSEIRSTSSKYMKMQLVQAINVLLCFRPQTLSKIWNAPDYQ